MTLFFLFLDYYVKDNNIYFNQDYTNETEMKGGRVWDIIKLWGSVFICFVTHAWHEHKDF